MGNNAQRYAKALQSVVLNMSETQAKETVQRFKALLKKRGDIKLVYRVIQEYKKLQAAQEGKGATIVSAKPLSAKTLQHIRQSLLAQGFAPTEQVNPELVGGMAVFLGNEYLIDHSIRGKLRRIATN